MVMNRDISYKQKDTRQYISTPMSEGVNYAQTLRAKALWAPSVFFFVPSLFLSPLRSFVLLSFLACLPVACCLLLAAIPPSPFRAFAPIYCNNCFFLQAIFIYLPKGKRGTIFKPSHSSICPLFHDFFLVSISLFFGVLYFSLTNGKIYAVAAKFISGRNFFIYGCSEIYIRKKFFYIRLQRNLYQEEIFLYAVAAKFILGRNFFICGSSEIYIRKKFFYIRLQRNLYQEEIFLYTVAAKFISGRNFFIYGYSEIYIRKKFSCMRLQRNLYQEKILCTPIQRNLYNTKKYMIEKNK
jgi:hypothetical protein